MRTGKKERKKIKTYTFQASDLSLIRSFSSLVDGALPACSTRLSAFGLLLGVVLSLSFSSRLQPVSDFKG
jgi:hypothetical protein